MKIMNAKVGTEVKDKLTGIAYRITEVSVTNNRVTEATATEIVPEDEERTEEPKQVVINGQNDITFTTTKWIADTAEHEVAIDEDGALVIDGEPVQMGELKAIRVLKQFVGDEEKNRPTVIVFTTESELEDEDVRLYIPSRDKMDKLGHIPADVTLVEDSDTRQIYGFSFTKEIEVTEGDKTEKKTVFDRAGLGVLTRDRFDMFKLDTFERDYDDDEYDDDEYDEYDDYEENEDVVDLQDVVDDDKFMGFDMSRAVMAQGEKFLYIPMQVEDAKEVTYIVVRVTNRASYTDKLVVPADLTAVTRNRTGKPVGPAIFVGKGYVKIADFVAKSNKLEGYIYLVDANKDERNNGEYTYVLASEDRQTIVIKRTVTQDRGTIVTVE